MNWLKRGLQELAAAGLRLPGLRQSVQAAARAGVLPQSVWRRLPVTGRFPIRVGDRIDLWYRSGLMDHLGRVLFFDGAAGWEPEILRVLPTLAERADGILDVGAHTGLFALIALAANPSARAVAIEPGLGNALLLQTNLRENGFAGRCVLAVAAAAAEPGTVPFDLGPVEVPMTSAIRDAADTGGVRVPAVTIDAVAGWLPSVDLIKIDVEGFEHLTLAIQLDPRSTEAWDLKAEFLAQSKFCGRLRRWRR